MHAKVVVVMLESVVGVEFQMYNGIWLVRRYINGVSSSAISTSLTLNLYLKYSYLELSIVEELNG